MERSDSRPTGALPHSQPFRSPAKRRGGLRLRLIRPTRCRSKCETAPMLRSSERRAPEVPPASGSSRGSFAAPCGQLHDVAHGGVSYWFVVAVKNCPQRHVNVSVFTPTAPGGRSRATRYIVCLQVRHGCVCSENGSCCRRRRRRAVDPSVASATLDKRATPIRPEDRWRRAGAKAPRARR